MARRRGFLAEIQHQARLAEQKQRAAAREQLAAARRAEQAQRAAERAQVAATRAADADRKRLEREALVAHVAAMQAEVESLNIGLAEKYADLDGILEATLGTDDYVDLETLRVVVEHPPFPGEKLRHPTPMPGPIPDPPLPVRGEVAVPTGMFGKKKKLAEAQAAVERQYAIDYYTWQAATEALPGRRAAQAAEYADAERVRLAALADAEQLYESECAERERVSSEQNEELDQLIAGLGYGTVEAVQEYVSIVLMNSVYPEHFPVNHGASFDPTTAELTLRLTIPGPELVPTIKSYKYTKSTDQIVETQLSQKDVKERYAGIVHQVALRSVHEVFEADRRELVRSISLELGANTISPATGREIYVPFVAVAVERGTFAELDLSAVVPLATLEHLGATVSKNPVGLVGIDSSGIRRL